MSTAQQSHQFAGTQEEREKIVRAMPAQAAAPKQRRKLLVVTLNVRDGKAVGGHAAIGYGNFAIALMGQTTGAYETVFDNGLTRFRPEELRQFDAVCFNNTCGVWRKTVRDEPCCAK